jgi:hypothetical protein
MLDWIDHHATAIIAVVAIMNWLCTIFSHYRLKWLIGKVHRAVNGKMLNGSGKS